MSTTGRQAAHYHWPALDGLRGIAVLAVIAFHAWDTATPNGFAGVDIFFALSGFLITSLLLVERDANRRVDFKAFYVRRFLRLLPALLACVVMVLLLAVVGDGPSAVYPAAAAAVFYVSHLWIYSGHDAWLLEHTWTLSLEEHYYLVWPVFLVAMLALKRSWRPLAAVLAALLAIVTAMTMLLPDGTMAAYVRGVPMLVGSAAAIVWSLVFRGRRLEGKVSGALSAIALIGLILLVFWPQALPMAIMSGWGSLPGIVSTLVVLGFVLNPTSKVAAALSAGWLRWTGRRAYGLYLYHFPILSIFTHNLPIELPRLLVVLLAVAIVFVVAAASYRWLELPFLRLKSRFRPTPAERREEIAG